MRCHEGRRCGWMDRRMERESERRTLLLDLLLWSPSSRGSSRSLLRDRSFSSRTRSSSLAAGDVREDRLKSRSSSLKVRARFLRLSLDERKPSYPCAGEEREGEPTQAKQAGKWVRERGWGRERASCQCRLLRGRRRALQSRARAQRGERWRRERIHRWQAKQSISLSVLDTSLTLRSVPI